MTDGFDKFDIEWNCGKCDLTHHICISGQANDYGLIGVMVKLVMDDIFPTVFGWNDGYRYEVTDDVIKLVLMDSLIREEIELN